MKFLNFRLGFATNSSSSHSFAFSKETLKDSRCSKGEFDWETFVAASDRAKLLYLAITADDVLKRNVSKNMSARSVLADNLLGGKINLSEDNYIDHQSVYNLPTEWDGKYIDTEFVKEFKDFLMQTNLVILGGNDNDEDEKILFNLKNNFELQIPKDSDGKFVARKDKKYGFWTMFDRTNGTKYRFDFSDKKIEPKKSYAPELIDIKITDNCPFAENKEEDACSHFCYQNSKKGGAYFDKKLVYSLAKELAKLKVFEVAIGGGEPTSHPNFINILETFRYHYIVPNFSTRNLDWLKDYSEWHKILELCGAFAYSVRNVNELKDFIELINSKGYKYFEEKVTIQLVLGTFDRKTFKEMLTVSAKSRLKVTLLGFKNVGKGSKFKSLNSDWWIDVIQELSKEGIYLDISIDTVITKKYEKELLANDVYRWMFYTEEGKFSAYIDAVNGKFGPSSFCKKVEMVDLENEETETHYYDNWTNDLSDKIIKAYENF